MSEKDEAFFSPGEGPRRAIIQLLSDARKAIDICVFTITDDTIAKAIVEAHSRGIHIRILTDNKKAEDRGSDVTRLESYGIAVTEDRSRHHMHHKFMIVDHRVLLTGSYNWTRSAAEFNQENVLITHQLALIEAYSREFESLWSRLTEATR